MGPLELAFFGGMLFAAGVTMFLLVVRLIYFLLIYIVALASSFWRESGRHEAGHPSQDVPPEAR